MAKDTVIRSSLVSAAMLAVAACSQSGERVFTRQNQAASALATLGMEAETKSPRKFDLDLIYDAEDQLHEACAPLRKVASTRMSGQEVGFDTQLVALASLDRCETETTRVEGFIWKASPTVARTYLGPKGAQEALK